MNDGQVMKRLKLLVLAILLYSLAVAGRLLQLQVFCAERFEDLAIRQAQEAIEVDLPRAALVDRNGIPLASSVRCPSLFTFDPQGIEDPESLSREVSKLSGRPADSIVRDLKTRKTFTWIARKLPFNAFERARAISEAHEGCELMEEAGRFYPHDVLASNLIGCMGTDGGLAGLEHQWDKVLSGGKRKFLVMRDAVATTLIPLEVIPDVDPIPTSIRLTIDSALQYQAESALDEAFVKYRATCGVVIVIDPRNGDILAMAVRPTYDPNRHPGAPREAWRNRAVTDAFEPGSTFKMITVAGALQSGRFSPEDTLNIGNGTMQVGPKLIHDDHPPRKSVYTVNDVITFSSNVGAAKIGMAMGQASLYHYIRLFGFGQLTPLALEAERTGQLRPPEKWSELSLPMLSFGQEIAVTPLQLTLAYAVVASGGYRVVPRLLPDAPLPPPERILSPATVDALNIMLGRVVTEGTGKAAAIPGVAVAGKTGTAQKLGIQSPDGRRLFTAYFAGYAPVDDPKVVCLAMIDEPVGAFYGGAVSAPIFSRVVSFSLSRLRAPGVTSDFLLAERRHEL